MVEIFVDNGNYSILSLQTRPLIILLLSFQNILLLFSMFFFSLSLSLCTLQIQQIKIEMIQQQQNYMYKTEFNWIFVCLKTNVNNQHIVHLKIGYLHWIIIDEMIYMIK